MVSVILPVYNQEKYLQETIQSILDQSFQQFELIILDDGSTDNSARIIREFTGRDTRIRAYYNANAGKSISTNYLVGQARGEWCAFIDADDVMLPGRLQRQVALHTQSAGVHASSCNCYYINGQGNLFGTQRYNGLGTIAEYRATIKRKKFITCSYTGLMVNKTTFIEVGGLNPMYEPCEDFEFLNRFVEAGFVLLVIPEVLMKYRIHSSAVTIQKPILVLDTITFVKHNIKLRRLGQPEVNYQAFSAIQNKYSWLTKFNKMRFNYSMIFFRNAGFAILSKKYLAFTWQIATSLMLSPDYVLKKVWNHLKK